MITEIVDETYRCELKNKINQSVEIAENGCWNWTKAKNGDGRYGAMKVKCQGTSQKVLSHRATWMSNVGKIPENYCVCHSCDNTICCNPDHLFLGTQKDNVRDMIMKGRRADFRGEKSGRAVLNDMIVKNIRELRSQNLSINEISEKLNINRHTCKNVVCNRSWRHI